MENLEDVCARLCLLTRACWAPELPRPLPRPTVRRMLQTRALQSLVLREMPQEELDLPERAKALLSRVLSVARLAEAYERRGYRAILPESGGWPSALNILGSKAPLFLFARGNADLLRGRRVAVAGSRDILPQTAAEAQRLGRALAEAGIVLVTGGARGVDWAAQLGALEAGGSVILVPAMPAEELLKDERTRHALEEGRLLMLCDTLPDDPFSAQKALSRNHTIYALGDAAVVMAARNGTGGSWRGATDCLSGAWSPVYVSVTPGADRAGNAALLRRGALPLDMDRPVVPQLRLIREIRLF